MPQPSYQNRKYHVVAYDPRWKKKFQAEEKILRSIFGNRARSIAHVGSTSVPGLAGKPTIDILVLVDNISFVDKLSPEMEMAGYQAFGEQVKPGARLFAKEEHGARLTNVHVFPKDHPHAKEMLRFRNYLRAHPKDVREYGNLKFALAKNHPYDYATYRRYKDEYMKKLLVRVRKSSD